LLAAALAARETLGAPLRIDELARIEPLIERWRAELGAAEFDALWVDGQALDLEAASDEALALDLS
jgi:hypothetical protein